MSLNEPMSEAEDVAFISTSTSGVRSLTIEQNGRNRGCLKKRGEIVTLV